MKIRNKIESYKAIIELNLNRFPEAVFKKNDLSEVKEFINRYPAKYYAIRDKSRAGGVFKLKVEPENILNEIKDYDLFSINVSSYNYVEKKTKPRKKALSPLKKGGSGKIKNCTPKTVKAQ